MPIVLGLLSLLFVEVGVILFRLMFLTALVVLTDRAGMKLRGGRSCLITSTSPRECVFSFWRIRGR